MAADRRPERAAWHPERPPTPPRPLRPRLRRSLMRAPTLAPSASPAAVEALLPAARDLADTLGDIPSRNRLMKEFKIGVPKANALRDALQADAADRQNRQDIIT